MRTVRLNSTQGGITRLRDKGSASPNALYDLVNGYVNNAKVPVIRPGTVLVTSLNPGGDPPDNLDPDTRGLLGWKGKLWTFCDHEVVMPNDFFQLAVVINPVDPTQALEYVDFAAPFVGELYIAATFADGKTFHYFLEPAETWLPNHVYQLSSVVQPTDPAGFVYKPSRLGNAFARWTPDAPRAVDDCVEPSGYNGFFYKVIEVEGANPRSGKSEPTWPTNDGETVIEETGKATSIPSTPPIVNGPPGDGPSGTTYFPPPYSHPGSENQQ